MIRIGVVNIDVSHPLAFSKVLMEESRARYAWVYNDGFRSDAEVEAFIRKRGLEGRCRTVDELAEKADVGFIQGCNWDKHLDYAEPFLRRGKPVFIDKPMVGSMRDIRRLEDMMRRGLKVMGCSSMRYADEIAAFLALPEEQRGEVINVMGTCGVDEFNYGIHIVEAIGALAKRPVSVRFGGAGDKGGKHTESFHVRFEDGATATYITVSGVWLNCDLLVTTTKAVYPISIDSGKIYKALLDRVCDQLETGKSALAPVEEILDSVRIMLAGRLSRQRGGEIVRLDEIPEDDPGYDGDAFEKGYAASAAPIYLGE